MSAGTGTTHFPSPPTVVSPIVLPSLSLTTILAPGSPLPVIFSSPSVISSITGLSSGVSTFPTVAVASSDGVFPSTVATAFITSFSFGSFPSGTFAVQLPLLSAVVVTFVPSGSSTTTLAFGSDVPVIVLSPAFGAVITGVAVCFVAVFESAFAMNVVSAVIALSAGASTFLPSTYHAGFS